MIKMICVKNNRHEFDDINLVRCPICGNLLREEEDGQQPGRQQPGGNTQPPSGQGSTQQPFVKPLTASVPEIGLSIILMDASSSMTDPAFDRIPATRLSLVASNAAQGIFDLDRMQNNPNAYVACFKFDDRCELMFVDSVANIIRRFRDVTTFEKYLSDELQKFLQGTDINKALQQAYDFVAKFLRKELDVFPMREYSSMPQTILKYNLESIQVPNIRVLVYSDGKQYVEGGKNILEQNPFTRKPIPNLNHDIVIGAFFGSSDSEGCRDLKNFVSRCPIHDIPQFFLFDDPANIDDLRYLFRMASGASGFCPRCLDKQLRR